MKFNIEYKTTYKQLIAYFLILAIAINSVAFFSLLYLENSLLEVRKGEFISLEENLVSLQTKLLGQNIDTIISDVLYLQKNLVAQVNGQRDLKLLASDWVNFSETSKIYDQIRFIDSDGNEKIRVNYKEGESYLVGDAELQNKKDRYYFTETVKLEKTQIYISKLDLNIENGAIEDPIKPMIRFSAPVYNQFNELEGIVILNYLAQGILDEFKDISKGSAGEVYLLDSNSYWLAGNSPLKEWGFMYEDKKNVNFNNKFPDEWADFTQTSGTFINENGLFIYSDVIVENNIQDNDTLFSNGDIILGDGNWKVVSFNSINGPNKSLISKNRFDKAIRIFWENIIYFMVLLIISMIISIFVYISKRSREKIKYLSEYDGLTKIYNRRAGLDSIAKLVPSDNRRRSRLSIAFVDINGLKDVNDNLGHELGDELITTFVSVTKSIIRETDFVVRMGGDEFLIVFTNANKEEAEMVWSRITARFNEINEAENRLYNISVSHGIIEVDDYQDKNLDMLIKMADEKMYEEKKEIKKTVVIIKEP
ncbi:MAG: diguanylate cyclase [Clostridia bacterium]|nr:diguanylate cyclase [Clostridia bacterium]